MAVKEVPELHLFAIRERAKGFITSLRSSRRYTEGYLDNLESSLAMLAEYADSQLWPLAHEITTGHMEEYFLYLQVRPRWFGDRDVAQRPISSSYFATQYRRLHRFFEWMVQRGFGEINPLAIIPHPRVEERTVPTVSQEQIEALFRCLDFQKSTTPAERFQVTRNRTVLFLLWDTPGRLNELATLTVDAVDPTEQAIRVMGKGRRERWMPLGAVATEALSEYMEVRAALVPRTDRLWVAAAGRPLGRGWLYQMLKRLGERAGVPGLHTHRFRHSYTIAALRNGMPEQILKMIAGWSGEIPKTYFRTAGLQDTGRIHRAMSPADNLWHGAKAPPKRPRKQGPSRGRL